MRTYTVEVTWRVSEYAHLIVKAETPEAAMAKALECSESGLPSKSNRAEDQDGDIQILKDPEYDYESNLGRDRVTGIWEGEEAYPNNAVTLPLPTTPEEELEAAIEALLRGVDACLRGGTALLSVTRPAEAIREAFAKYSSDEKGARTIRQMRTARRRPVAQGSGRALRALARRAGGRLGIGVFRKVWRQQGKTPMKPILELHVSGLKRRRDTDLPD